MNNEEIINGLLEIRKGWQDNIDAIDRTISILRNVGISAPSIESIKASHKKIIAEEKDFYYTPVYTGTTKSNKIIELLKREGRFMSKQEITDKLGFSGNIASTLSTTDGLKNVRAGLTSYWGLSEWVDEGGFIIEKYMYEKAAS